jgi:phosphate transport system permease protein
LSRRRRLASALSATLVWAAVAVAVIPLLLVMFTVVSKGASLITPRFLTSDLPIQARSAEGGVGPAVIGTLLITGVASLIAIPVGILAAIYLTEYGGKSRLARVIRFLSDVMAGVPSIVMGLFIFTVWVVRYQQRSGLAGSLALACLMLPIITVVLPAALPGVVSGCLLAIARAAGETAPLLFTIGLTYSKNLKLSGENTALSAQIFSNASTSFVAAQQRAWAAALTLIVIVLLLSVVARVVAARFTVR